MLCCTNNEKQKHPNYLRDLFTTIAKLSMGISQVFSWRTNTYTLAHTHTVGERASARTVCILPQSLFLSLSLDVCSYYTGHFFTYRVGRCTALSSPATDLCTLLKHSYIQLHLFLFIPGCQRPLQTSLYGRVSCTRTRVCTCLAVAVAADLNGQQTTTLNPFSEARQCCGYGYNVTFSGSHSVACCSRIQSYGF